jgi:hypothetical protein
MGNSSSQMENSQSNYPLGLHSPRQLEFLAENISEQILLANLKGLCDCKIKNTLDLLFCMFGFYQDVEKFKNLVAAQNSEECAGRVSKECFEMTSGFEKIKFYLKFFGNSINPKGNSNENSINNLIIGSCGTIVYTPKSPFRKNISGFPSIKIKSEELKIELNELMINSFFTNRSYREYNCEECINPDGSLLLCIRFWNDDKLVGLISDKIKRKHKIYEDALNKINDLKTTIQSLKVQKDVSGIEKIDEIIQSKNDELKMNQNIVGNKYGFEILKNFS